MATEGSQRYTQILRYAQNDNVFVRTHLPRMRLADRVRSGEIDVSSIAPDATDAAVVASVLAALLGGSRSR